MFPYPHILADTCYLFFVVVNSHPKKCGVISHCVLVKPKLVSAPVQAMPWNMCVITKPPLFPYTHRHAHNLVITGPVMVPKYC